VEEARGINTYTMRKDLGVDYRFWNVFHSNFYATTILGAKKSKIVTMQYIDWDEIQEKEEHDFDRVVRICDRFDLLALMSFQYHWNKEVLSQFHAAFFSDQHADELHWMTDD
jgi:hypothetical protein